MGEAGKGTPPTGVEFISSSGHEGGGIHAIPTAKGGNKFSGRKLHGVGMGRKDMLVRQIGVDVENAAVDEFKFFHQLPL